MAISRINHLLTELCNIERKVVTKDSNRNAIDTWNIMYSSISFGLFSHALYRQRIDQWYAKQAPSNIQRIGIFNSKTDIQSGDRITDISNGNTYYVSGIADSVNSRYGKITSHMEVFLQLEPL